MTQFDARNLSMVTDLYQMTMANGYFADGRQDDWATFDVFFRKNPDGAAFSVFAGLEQVLDFLEGMHFDERDVAYLRSLGLFDERFLAWLGTFEFRGCVRAMPEGTVVYPNEPILSVHAPLIDAQLAETAILAQVNHQSLVATKAQRIVRAAAGRAVSDFGARRAHNVDAAVVRCARRLYRRRGGHGDGAGGADVRLARRWNHGSQLGHVLRERIPCIQTLRRTVSGQRRASGGHLRRAGVGRAERHSRGEEGSGAARGTPCRRAD